MEKTALVTDTKPLDIDMVRQFWIPWRSPDGQCLNTSYESLDAMERSLRACKRFAKVEAFDQIGYALCVTTYIGDKRSDAEIIALISRRLKKFLVKKETTS